METILLLAHVEAQGGLSKAALEALGLAKSLGGTLVVGLAGEAQQVERGEAAGRAAADNTYLVAVLQANSHPLPSYQHCRPQYQSPLNLP